MPNGIWSRETYLMGVPESDIKRASMTFDMLESIDNRLINICDMPAKCEETMDKKIKVERKRRGKISLGLGGGGAAGAVGIWEIFKNWINSP